jgi:hypothetical protein
LGGLRVQEEKKEKQMKIQEMARQIYRSVYPTIDDKRAAARVRGQIEDWLIDGDIDGMTIDELVEEWKDSICEWFEENLTDEDISTFHEDSEYTPHVEALVAQAGIEGIEIWGSRTGKEPLTVCLLS